MNGRNILLFLLVVLATFTGCQKQDNSGTSYVPPPDPYVAPDGYMHLTNASGYPYRVFINGVNKFDLKIGEYRVTPLKPGPYAIRCQQLEGYKTSPGVTNYQINIMSEKTIILVFP
jgi:hypothetical protein